MGSAAGTPKDESLIYIQVPNVKKSELRKSGQMKKISLNDDDILLVYVNGHIYAFQEKCPHQGGPLELGEIEDLPDKTQCIKCPWHSWKFNISNGDCVFPGHKSNKRLTVYPVITDKEDIRIGFPKLSPKCFQSPTF